MMRSVASLLSSTTLALVLIASQQHVLARPASLPNDVASQLSSSVAGAISTDASIASSALSTNEAAATSAIPVSSLVASAAGAYSTGEALASAFGSVATAAFPTVNTPLIATLEDAGAAVAAPTGVLQARGSGLSVLAAAAPGVPQAPASPYPSTGFGQGSNLAMSNVTDTISDLPLNSTAAAATQASAIPANVLRGRSTNSSDPAAVAPETASMSIPSVGLSQGSNLTMSNVTDSIANLPLNGTAAALSPSAIPANVLQERGSKFSDSSAVAPGGGFAGATSSIEPVSDAIPTDTTAASSIYIDEPLSSVAATNAFDDANESFPTVATAAASVF